MKKTILLLLLATAILVFSGCNTEDTSLALDTEASQGTQDMQTDASEVAIDEEELLGITLHNPDGIIEVSYRPSGVHMYFSGENFLGNGYAFIEGAQSMFSEAVFYPEGEGSGESEPLYIYYQYGDVIISNTTEDTHENGVVYALDDESRQLFSQNLLTNDGVAQQWVSTSINIYSTYFGEMTPESTYVQMTTTDSGGELSLTIQGNGDWIFDGHSTVLASEFDMRGFYAGYDIRMYAEGDIVNVSIHYIDHEYMDDRYVSVVFEKDTGGGVYGNLEIDENSEPIEFVDPEMERLVSEFLGVEVGKIHKEHMELIEKLVIYGDSLWDSLPSHIHYSISTTQGGIKSLDDLAFCTNLSELYIGNNQISDISVLASLTNLEVINLMTNQISDLTPLSGLENLHTLILDHNMISDASPLISLDNLTSLNLGSNNNYSFADLQSISQMTTLQELTIYHNNISDLSLLSSLVELEILDLDSNTFSDLSPLQGLTNLSDLRIEDNMNLSDISPLLDMPNLDAVFVSDTNVAEIDTIFVLHTNQYGARG